MQCPKVLIVGAGPAGCLAALVFKKHGMDPVIYEQRSGDSSSVDSFPFWEVGGSVDLHENALRGLERLGVLEDIILNSGGTSKNFTYILMDGSDPISMDTQSRRSGRKNTVHILRASFHGALLRECKRLQIPVLFDRVVVDVTQSEKSVAATFANGTHATGDLLVAADGMHSNIRSIIFPEAKAPGMAGSGFIGLFELGKHSGLTGVPPLGFEYPLAFYADPLKGNGIYTVHCPEDNVGAWHILQLKHPKDGAHTFDPEWRPYKDLPKEATRLAATVMEWGAPASVVNAIRFSKRITPSHLWDLPDMKSLHKGRIVLIGDAGHGTLPTLGQGLGMAIEDCGVLHELLVNFPLCAQGYHTTVFALFEEIRLPRVHFVAASSREVLAHQVASSTLEMRVSRFIFKTMVALKNWLSLHDSVLAYNYEIDVAKVLEKHMKRENTSAASAA